jgi:hypothetical protein
MAYIGRPLQVANLAVQSGTGDGSDTTPIATLDYATTTNGIAVYLDGVRQLAGTDFNVTAQTTLTFTTAPANGVGVDVYFLGLELSLPTPADASVTTAKIADVNVTTGKIADDAITLAKMAAGTDGNIISYDASGNPVAIATGTDGQVLTSTGAGSPPAFEAIPVSGVTLGTAVASTSGTSIDFTGLPSGTKRITINIDQISTNSTSYPIVQIGDSGGFETSGYNGCIAWTQATNVVTSNVFTTGFGLFINWASGTVASGTMILSLLDPATFTWVASTTFGRNSVVGNWAGGGGKSLSAELTQIRLTTFNGSDTFDAGKINIQYE